MTDLERISQWLGASGLRQLADDLEMLRGWGRVTLYMSRDRWDRNEATRSSKNGDPAQLRMGE